MRCVSLIKENLLIIYIMDSFPRMSGFGQRIVSPTKTPTHTSKKSVYPFNSSPVSQSSPYNYTNLHIRSMQPIYPNPYQLMNYPIYPVQSYNNSNTNLESELKSKIKDLKRNIVKKKQVERNMLFIDKASSLLNSLEIKQSKEVKPPEPDKFLEILHLMQKQQENMLGLLQGSSQSVGGLPTGLSQEIAVPKVNRIQAQYSRFRKDPNKINEILDSIGLKEDEEDIYLDEDRNFKFDPTLPEVQKIDLLQKLKLAREAREVERRKAQIKGKSKFRVIGLVVLFPILTYKSIMERKSRTKLASIRTMEESIKVYLEVGKTWVLKAVRNPLTSVLNDPNLDLNISSKDRIWNISQIEANKLKLVKIQVRIRGIIEGFIDNTTEAEMPGPLRLFIDKLTSNGTFLPSSYLLPFEKSRLELDSFGALKAQSASRKQMMVCFFFFTRILIGMLLLKPEENGLTTRKSSKITQ